MTNDAHHNEYLAAINGMADTYGWREAKALPALGDHVMCVVAGRAEEQVRRVDAQRLAAPVVGIVVIEHQAVRDHAAQ